MNDLDYLRAEAVEWGPRILGAIAILIVAWLVARAAKWAIAKLVDRVPALRKHYDQEPGATLGTMLGEIAFWLILLIGIVLALQPLQLSGVLTPVQVMTSNALSFVPNVIGAGVIFVVGLVIAKIVRRLVESALMAANIDGWLNKASSIVRTPDRAPADDAAPTARPPVPVKASISRSVGMLVFLLIMVPVTISALDALRIEAISTPATQMLRTILDAIPNVLGALILLAIGYFIGGLVKQAIDQILPTLGFDRAVAEFGVPAQAGRASRAVGTIAMIAIMIFFAIKAAELLNSPLIATMLAEILELGSRVIVGAAIILAAAGIAKIVTRLVAADGRGWLPTILQWSIIALGVAMGLRFMGLANEIVIIAFAGIIGSAAVASALAFGLGGRATAGRLLDQWAAKAEQGAAPTPPLDEPAKPSTIPPG